MLRFDGREAATTENMVELCETTLWSSDLYTFSNGDFSVKIGVTKLFSMP